MRAILVHGLGRTPASMGILAARLRNRGFQPALFAYSATFESFAGCTERLRGFIDRRAGGSPFIVVGHSLGTVLLRSVYPRLRAAPIACFLIAPPARACRAAGGGAPQRLFRVLTGDMGRLLANAEFMDALPVPRCPTRTYAGTGGLVRRWLPFGDEPNDGILSVSETVIPGVPTIRVGALHTFIMNAAVIADDIEKVVSEAAG
jgi:alpha/beta hydrolase family protein